MILSKVKAKPLALLLPTVIGGCWLNQVIEKLSIKDIQTEFGKMLIEYSVPQCRSAVVSQCRGLANALTKRRTKEFTKNILMPHSHCKLNQLKLNQVSNRDF